MDLKNLKLQELDAQEVIIITGGSRARLGKEALRLLKKAGHEIKDFFRDLMDGFSD